jgi:cation diffusion facilitator CzcD-associated flavoprotein CzcO
VFQRSAPYVLAKPDRAYRARALRAFRRVPGLLRLSREANYFSNELRSLGFNTEPRLLFAHRARFRAHLERQVPDPVLRQKLTPTDPMGCKRILMSNDWYPALQLPQVEVVGDRIAEVRPHSIVTADGTERPVDTVILGTGFAATEFLAPMRIRGRGGRDLHEQWKDGASAYLGTVVPGFPNLFVLYGPNTNLGHNSIIVMLEAQVGWVVQAVRAIARGAVLDVRRDVAEAFDAWVQERLGHTVFAGGCRSWYLTESGRNTQNWPASTLTFRRRLRRFRSSDFEVVPAAVGGPAGRV